MTLFLLLGLDRAFPLLFDRFLATIAADVDAVAAAAGAAATAAAFGSETSSILMDSWLDHLPPSAPTAATKSIPSVQLEILKRL